MKPLSLLSPIQGKKKPSQVSESLVQLARTLGPEGEFPSFRELCRTLVVAKATLDKGLRQLEGRGLIERRHGKGIYVTPQIMQKTIGLVIGKNIFLPGVSPFYLQLMEKCGTRAAAHQERFSFYLDIDGVSPRLGKTPVHRDLEEALSVGALDGVILASRNSLTQEAWLRACGVPLVVLGHGSPHLASVDVDHVAMVESGVGALAKQGCTSLGVLGAWSEDVDAFGRFARERGIASRPEWKIDRIDLEEQVPGDSSVKHEAIGVLAARRLLAAPSLPQGLLSTDDMMTRGACRTLEEAGVRVGRDIQIASHTNKDSTVLGEWIGRMTRLEIDPEAVVEASFALLESVMNKTIAGRTVVYVKPELKTL